MFYYHCLLNKLSDKRSHRFLPQWSTNIASGRAITLFLLLVVALISILKSPRTTAETYSNSSETFTAAIITDQLDYPWGMTFIGRDNVLVTEKSGTIKRVNLTDGKVTEVTGAPRVTRLGQGGLLDIEKHPDFSTNNKVYLTYTKAVSGGVTTAVASATLQGNRLVDLKDILVTNAIGTGGRHFGSRLAFGGDNTLFVTVGDRGERERAQKLSSHAGKVLRIHDDGRIPSDNPFVKRTDAQPEIYTYGNRNPQGMVYDDATNRLWLHEHGPKGGDEVNLVAAGNNYGWPVITYGREYSGWPITDETHREGMEQPVWKWVPSIAPSGLAIYRGDVFPQWEGNLLVGALKYKLLVLLDMDGDVVKKERRVMQNHGERIRDVTLGPDGHLYLLTDSANGQLIKISP